MTNSEYILSQMTDYNLSMLFTGMYNYCSAIREEWFTKIYHAFNRWRILGERPLKPYYDTNTPEDQRPSVYTYTRICKDGKWGAYQQRTNQVAFQVWLSLQYDPKEWE